MAVQTEETWRNRELTYYYNTQNSSFSYELTVMLNGNVNDKFVFIGAMRTRIDLDYSEMVFSRQFKWRNLSGYAAKNI